MLYWISFASKTEFLGVVIVEAHSLEDARAETSRRGLNPGGEALISEVPTAADRHHAWPYRNRLLTKAECEAITGPACDPNEYLEAAGDRAAVVREKCNAGIPHEH